MAYRTFVDSTGTEWQVWDIVPQLRERRGELNERRLHDVEVPFNNRRRDARRITESPRAVLRGMYAQGWLCFESSKEKRRLTPIPEDWTTCSDELLEAYMKRGERAVASRVMLDFGDDTFAEAG